MSKYDGLGVYLGGQKHTEIPMTFSEIEQVAGVKLPPKAQQHRAWWSNNPSNNVMTKVWLAAGYETAQVDMTGRKLVFKRKSGAGLAEPVRAFQAPEPQQAKPRRHPIFGVLKGSFTIQFGWQIERPAMDAADLESLETGLENKARVIAQGSSR